MRICIALFLAIFPFVSFGQADDAVSLLLKQGIELHDKKDFEGAIKLYDEILSKDPNNSTALYEKSLSLYSWGKYDECISLCKFIIKKYPKEKDGRKVYVTYGSALDGLGNSDEAIKIYSEGIKKYPASYLLYFNRGITQYSQKNVEKAISDFQKSVSLNPAHASSHQGLAYCMYDKNKIASAMALSAFLLIEPEGQRAEKNLKLLLQVLGSNVEKKDDKNITISLSSSLSSNIMDKKNNQPDDFSIAELTLSLKSALHLSDEKKNMGAAEKLKEKLGTIAIISTSQKKSKQGFFTKFYVPFFKQMNSDSLLQVASYIIYSSSNQAEIKNWLNENKDKADAFHTWLQGYVWIKEDD